MGEPGSVSLSELARMDPGERRETIRALLDVPRGVAVRRLNKRLRKMERDHGMSTETMLSRWKSGELKDTPEIARWLFLASARGDDE